MNIDKFLVLNNNEYLVIDELTYNNKKYIYVNSMTDEREIAILEEYEEDGKTKVKSIEDSEFNIIMNEFSKKIVNNNERTSL